MDLLFGIILLSIFVGSIAVLAGLGGGVLLVPIVVILYAFPIQVIISSVLISLIIPASIGAFGAYQRNEIDIKLALLFEIPTAFGAFLGARTSSTIDEVVLKVIFSVVALLLSVKMIQDLQSDETEDSEETLLHKLGHIEPTLEMEHNQQRYRISLPVLLIGGIIIGFLSGMLGVGGGWIKVPILILAFGVRAEVATGTSLFMIVMTAIIGGSTHIFYGNVDQVLTVSLIIGLGLGAFIGNSIKTRIRTKHISWVISICLIFVSILMLF